MLYSAGGTALLTPVAGLGLVVGPALGHFYAGAPEQAWMGIAIRTGAAGAAGIGGVLALGAPQLGWGLLTVGATVVIGSALYDIATAWRSARDYNEAHGLNARITPSVGPEGKQVGLTLHVSL